MRYTYHALVPLIGIIFVFFFSIILVRYRKDNPLVKKLLVINIVGGVWYVQMLGFYLIVDPAVIAWWSRVFLLAMIVAPAVMFDFCTAFTRQAKRYRVPTILIWSLSGLFAVLNACGLFAHRFVMYKDIKYIVVGTPWYLLFFVYFVFCILVLCPAILVHEYRGLTNYRQKAQYKYLLLAYTVTIAIASTNFLSNLGLNVYPLGALSSIFFIGILMYAIIRHELLDIKIIIKQTVLFSTLTFFITAVYAAVLGIAYLLFNRQFQPKLYLLPGLVTIVVIIFLFQPVRQRVQRVLERIFHREAYDYRAAVTELSRIINQEIEPDRLFELLAGRIISLLNAHYIGVFNYNAELDAYECQRMETHPVAGQPPSHPATVTVSKDSPLIGFFTRHHTLVNTERDPAQSLLFDQVARHPDPPAIAVPFFHQDELIGFMVLGPRLSGLPFFPTDLELLTTVANQAAVVLRTLNLFREMEKVRERLYAQNKMAALGALAFGIAHEIKNPLTPIRTFTQMITRKPFLSEREQEMGTRVLEEFQRVDDMLSSLLNYGKAVELKMVPTSLPALLDEVLALFRDILRKQGIRKTTAYAPAFPAVQADPQQLKQVFMNIIGNAMEAMPVGGSLTVAVEHHAAEKKVVVAFTDTGCGIPPENHEKVFKYLFTTKEHGTGLGLAICKKIIKEHQGAIWLKSEKGQGTTFFVSFNA
jgi:signal transduction histidine kinase